MAKNGAKTGGRKKGTPNRLTADVGELLNDLAAQGLFVDPIEFLARVMANDKAFFSRSRDISLAVRMKAAQELAPYRAPKRKAIEVSGASGAPQVMIIADKKAAQTWEHRAQEVRDEQQRQLQQVTK